MIDVSADQGWLVTALRVMQLVQMVLQGRWIHDSPILTLPHVEHQHLQLFRYVELGKFSAHSVVSISIFVVNGPDFSNSLLW